MVVTGSRLSVSVCMSVHFYIPTLLHVLDGTWGNGRECPLVVH